MVKLENAVGDRNLCQARATPPARKGSRDVIDHMTNLFPMGYLLFVVHWYQVSYLYSCFDSRSCCLRYSV